MQPTSDTDYKSLFGQLIKKQMLVLGPDITLAKVRNVTGLTVDINGDVQKIDGDPQLLLQSLINQFVELSGMIVKKTMESILTSYPGMMAMAVSPAFGGSVAPATPDSSAISTPSPTVQAVTSTPSIPVTKTVSQPQLTQSADTTDIIAPVTDSSNLSTHIEPPAMSSVSLESLTPQKPKEVSQNPATFSSEEMADLNKALEDLSKAPLTTEKSTV